MQKRINNRTAKKQTQNKESKTTSLDGAAKQPFDIVLLQEYTVTIYNPNSMHLVPNLKHQFRAPTVLPLTYQTLAQYDIKNATWSEKTDGTRYCLVFHHNETSKETILDTELLNNVYHIFDIIYHEDECLITVPFQERFLKVQPFYNQLELSKKKLLNNSIIVKQLYSISDNSKWIKEYPLSQYVQKPTDLTDFINSYNISPITKNPIDGVVIQCESKMFKYKRTVLNTNDFLIKLLSPNKYALYAYVADNFSNQFRRHYPLNEELRAIDTRNKNKHFKYNMDKAKHEQLKAQAFLEEMMDRGEFVDVEEVLNSITPKSRTNLTTTTSLTTLFNDARKEFNRDVKYNKDPQPPSTIKCFEPLIQQHLIFVSPFHKDSYFMDVSKQLTTIEKQQYFPEEVKEINKLIKEMQNDNNSFDNKVIEVSWTGLRWVPMRKRWDKYYANHYSVCLSNTMIAFSPLYFEQELYFARKMDIEEQISKNISQFTLEDVEEFRITGNKLRDKIIETITTFLDTNNIKVSSAIDLAGGRGGDLKTLLRLNVKNIFATDLDKPALCTYAYKAFGTAYAKQSLFFNAFYCNLNEDESVNDLITNIQSRKEFNDDVDIIIYNYAVHYSVEHLNNIRHIVKTFLTKPNSVFIYSYFDVETFRALPMKNKYRPRFKGKNESGHDIIDVPILTISRGEYSEEPSVASYELERIVDNNLFDTYEFDNIVDYIDKTNVSNDLIEYFKAIRLRIVLRKECV